MQDALLHDRHSIAIRIMYEIHIPKNGKSKSQPPVIIKNYSKLGL